MKNLFLLLAIVTTLFTSCKKENIVPKDIASMMLMIDDHSYTGTNPYSHSIYFKGTISYYDENGNNVVKTYNGIDLPDDEQDDFFYCEKVDYSKPISINITSGTYVGYIQQSTGTIFNGTQSVWSVGIPANTPGAWFDSKERTYTLQKVYFSNGMPVGNLITLDTKTIKDYTYQK